MGHSGLLRVAFAAWALASLALAACAGPLLPIAASALFGAGMGVAVPALTVLTGDHAPPGRRGQATALLATAGFAGQFAAPLGFGPLAAATSTPVTFLAAAVLAAATAATLVRRGRGPRTGRPATAGTPAGRGPRPSA